MIEPVGVGTRSDMPSSLPLSSGITWPIARAAPVVFGMIDSAAARMRRRSGLPLRVATAWSCSCWSLVYACTVLMKPLLDAEPLVQHLAPSAPGSWSCTTRWRSRCAPSASYAPSFTPMQIITSASPDGAEITTRLAPPLRCSAGLLAGREEAGRLDHDVDAVVAPRDLRGLALLELLDLDAVDREAVAVVLDLVRDACRRRSRA